jgi:hypothetical protein
VAYGVPYGYARSNFVHGKVRPTGILTWTGDGSSWFVIRSIFTESGLTMSIRTLPAPFLPKI